MESATTFGTVDVPGINADELQIIQREIPYLEGSIDAWCINPKTRQVLEELWPDADGHSLCATMWVGPHIDEYVVGDVTLGIILSGDHYLFTGNGRRVGDLVPGTVFALCNKKTYGAYARNKSNRTPLVFATCEPKVNVRDWPTFCLSIEQKIRSRQALSD